jgi:hypothetical protein
MDLIEILEKNKHLFYGKVQSQNEIDFLINQLPKIIIPNWFLELLKKYPLAGVKFSLRADEDESGLGVDLKWYDAKEIVDEAMNYYPGLAVIKFGYLPVGSCLVGSGDPYFIKFENNDPSIVRIPHDYLNEDDTYPVDKIEIVCNKLSIFFTNAVIEF